MALGTRGAGYSVAWAIGRLGSLALGTQLPNRKFHSEMLGFSIFVMGLISDVCIFMDLIHPII